MPDTIKDAIAAIARGEMIVVTDSEDRENEGDIVCAAEAVTPAIVNFMAKFGRGLVCAPITAARARHLQLPEMPGNKDRHGTAFTLSIDAREGTTTGISAGDRARTIELLVDPDATHEDFFIPGHVFPLVAREGGVLARAGHTEAIVDLARLAGKQPAGVICEIMNDDGTMARVPEIREFAAEHKLLWVTIADLIAYREEVRDIPEHLDTLEHFLAESGSVRMPCRYTAEDFVLHGYFSESDGKEHVALVLGDIEGAEDLLVRVHSECLTGDAFGSARCDCGQQLETAMKAVAAEGKGVIVYLRQEGRGIGLINKIRAYSLQDQGLDTVDANVELGFPADLRDYSVAAEIIQDLKIKSLRLLTNNPAKVDGLRRNGIVVNERVPLVIPPEADNAFYLQTKKERLGHIL